MKKTLLTLSLLACTASAFAATSAPAPQSVAANTPAAEAPATEQAAVTVTGATTKAGAPLMLSVDGAKAIDPTFLQLFTATQANPKWAVTKVATRGEKSRMSLLSSSSKSTLDMDVDARLVTDLKIKKGSVVTTEAQSSGQVAIIKFLSGTTPLGFMVNQASAVTTRK